MWEIWANLRSPKALKSCPKSNKSPNLVTLQCLCNLLSFCSSFALFRLKAIARRRSKNNRKKVWSKENMNEILSFHLNLQSDKKSPEWGLSQDKFKEYFS